MDIVNVNSLQFIALIVVFNAMLMFGFYITDVLKYIFIKIKFNH